MISNNNPLIIEENKDRIIAELNHVEYHNNKSKKYNVNKNIFISKKEEINGSDQRNRTTLDPSFITIGLLLF